MNNGDDVVLTEDTEFALVCASDIEIVVGSDNHKAKGGGTLVVKFKHHDNADWATVKTFDTADVIEDFKSKSVYGGKYKLVLDGATDANLQVSWKM